MRLLILHQHRPDAFEPLVHPAANIRACNGYEEFPQDADIETGMSVSRPHPHYIACVSMNIKCFDKYHAR